MIMAARASTTFPVIEMRQQKTGAAFLFIFLYKIGQTLRKDKKVIKVYTNAL